MISALSSSWRTNIARQNHVPRCWRNWWSVLSHIAEDGSWTLQQHEVSVTSLMKAHFWRKLYMWVIHWNILCWPICVSCMNVFHFRPLTNVERQDVRERFDEDYMKWARAVIKYSKETQVKNSAIQLVVSGYSEDCSAHVLHGNAWSSWLKVHFCWS